MKRLLSLLTILSLLAFSIASANATPPMRPPSRSLVDVQVIDKTTGQRLEIWRQGGKSYVAGKPGNRYALSLRNNTGKRVAAVISVDGVNAITGQTAKTSQRAYVLSPRQRTEVAGWRKSQQEVAAFYFTQLDDSYAARTDRPDNVGVIGVAVFREYEPPPPPPVTDVEHPRAVPAPSGAAPTTGRRAAKKAAARPTAGENLGTGHGERIDAPTRSVEFKRARSSPDQIVSIFYDSRTNLIARGIIPVPQRPPHSTPQAFPDSYVPDPK